MISKNIYSPPKLQLHFHPHCQFSSFQNTCHLSTWNMSVSMVTDCNQNSSNRRRTQFSIHAPMENGCVVCHGHRSFFEIKSNSVISSLFVVFYPCLQQKVCSVKVYFFPLNSLKVCRPVSKPFISPSEQAQPTLTLLCAPDFAATKFVCAVISSFFVPTLVASKQHQRTRSSREGALTPAILG